MGGKFIGPERAKARPKLDLAKFPESVAREQGVEDRRQVYIKLTKHGSEILEQLSGTHRAEIRRLGPRLGLLLKSLMLDQNR